MKFGLPDELIAGFCSVFSAHIEIEEVIIYGSRAVGTYREGSDIDITLQGDKLTPRIISIIATELDELNSPYKIDISIFSDLKNEKLIEQIKRHGQLFYKKRTQIKKATPLE